MKIVVDTNILFSALISTQSHLRDILLEHKGEFYAPNYLFVELFRYKDKMMKYTKLSEEEMYEYLNILTEKIHFIQVDFISVENRQIAYDLCKDKDIKDTLFVALSLELDAKLWTGDKKLKTYLIQKGFSALFEY
jgi:putative PIN family toxin of toxin-antitoxin system